MLPTITTDRLLLRKIVPADQPKIFEGLSHPAVIRYYGVSYNSLEATAVQMEFYENLLADETGAWWGICHKQAPDEIIGACGLNNFDAQHKNIEIGYWLLPQNQGAGYMFECLPHIIAYAFREMKAHRITAVVEEGNATSGKLLTKLGFQYEGTLRESEMKNGRFISLRYYALLNA